MNSKENSSWRTGPSSPRAFGPPRRGRLRWLAALAIAGSIGLACEIAPVVSAPDALTGRHADCSRAAEDYCELVLGTRGKDQDRCVAEHTFECVSAGRE